MAKAKDNEQPETLPLTKRGPVTQQEIFDAETRIVRMCLKRISLLPDEKSRTRVLNRIYELREFPLIDQTP